MRYIIIIMLLFTTNSFGNDDVKKAAVELGKYYGKEFIDQYDILDNDYVKYGGGLISTIKDEEINISINDAKINIQEDNIQITKTWRF